MSLVSRFAAAVLLAAMLASPHAAAAASRRATAPAAPRAAASSAPEGELRVLVLGLNDLHGQITAGRKVSGKPVGSAGVLAAWLRASIAAHDGPAFLALAGDCVGASPAASALLQDEPTIDFLGSFADATCRPRVARGRTHDCNVVAALGNHEFDEGWREMLRLWRGGTHAGGPYLRKKWTGARFPVLCANVIRKDTGRTLMPPSVILDADGVRMGFIGAVVSSTPSLVTPSGVAGLRFLDEAERVNAEAESLSDRGVKAIVLVLHEGGRQEPYDGWTKDEAPEVTGRVRSIVSKLHPAIDLVVSGHTHQFTNARLPREEGGPVLVTQAWSAGSAFTEVELTLDRVSGDVTASRARLVTTWAESGPGLQPDAGAAALAGEAERAVAPRVERVVATIAARITRAPGEAGESALGNLIADAQRLQTNADVALMNPGGIRTDLDAGPATWGELFAIQPFGNTLTTVELTGAELLQALEPRGAPGSLTILQGSGVEWTWDPEAPAGRRVIHARVGGSPLDAAQTYRVTVNSFLVSGGDGFNVFAQGRNPVGGPVDLDVLVAHLGAQAAPVRAAIEGRIRIEKAVSD